MKLELRNFRGYIAGGSMSFGCETDGARYHVWINNDGTPRDDVVFKNPPLLTPHGSDGDFRTRRLSRTKGEGLYVFDRLMANAASMVVQAHADEDKRQAIEQAEHVRRVIVKRKTDAAEHLFELLKVIVMDATDKAITDAEQLIEDIERPVK